MECSSEPIGKLRGVPQEAYWRRFYRLELAVVEDHVILSSPFNHGIGVFLKSEDIVAGCDLFAESGFIGKTLCSGSFKVTLEVIYIY